MANSKMEIICRIAWCLIPKCKNTLFFEKHEAQPLLIRKKILSLHRKKNAKAEIARTPPMGALSGLDTENNPHRE
jgi:hypothetical protein